MTTAYALLLLRCGLSHREAADFHQVRPDTVKSWSIGRNRSPPGPMAELRRLHAAIEVGANQVLAQIEAIPGDDLPTAIELGLASDDAEAQSLGWPCVGAHEALLGLVVARSTRPVAVVPRGSTAATAAAIRPAGYASRGIGCRP